MNPLLLGFTLLLVKHFLGDFVLQTQRQVTEKGSYGRRGGIEHAGIHAALTIPCLLAIGVAPGTALAAAAAELVVHYHIDWGKEQVNRVAGYTPAEPRFWVLLGGDQLAHQLTYVAMLGLVA